MTSDNWELFINWDIKGLIMGDSNKGSVILGGGLAGLSACYHGTGEVYEQNKRTGGHARSHKSKDFIFMFIW